MLVGMHYVDGSDVCRSLGFLAYGVSVFGRQLVIWALSCVILGPCF